MQIQKKHWLGVAALSLLVVQGSMARDHAEADGGLQAVELSLLSSAFDSPPSSTVEILDDQHMADTQGELWPWIFGVVTVDLSLASFFWGTYLPTVGTTGGACITCDVGSKAR